MMAPNAGIKIPLLQKPSAIIALSCKIREFRTRKTYRKTLSQGAQGPPEKPIAVFVGTFPESRNARASFKMTL